MNAVLVKILLTHQAMSAHSQAVICGKDDDGVFSLSRLLERRQHPANLSVNVSNHSIVLSDVSAELFRRSRPGRKSFITNPHLAIIKRMLRHKILRQSNLFGLIHILILLRRRPRVMRGRIGDIHEEWFVLLIVPQEMDSSIAEQLAGMFSFLVVYRFLAISSCRVKVTDRNLVVVAHPPEEDISAGCERPGERLFPVMPLACPEGNVASLAQSLRQHSVFRRYRATLVHQVEQVLT